MHIEILQAGTGGSIWTSHNKKNVVIDGGKSTTAIKTRYDKIPLGETIDLLVVTHINSDHIAGVMALVKHMKENGKSHRLKQVWFSFSKKEEADEYFVAEGDELASLPLGIDGVCWNNNAFGLLDSAIEVGDMKLRVLTPDHDAADKYKPNSSGELGVYPENWYVNLRTLIDNVNDDDMDEGGPSSRSAVVPVKREGKKLLRYCPRESLNNLLKHL